MIMSKKCAVNHKIYGYKCMIRSQMTIIFCENLHPLFPIVSWRLSPTFRSNHEASPSLLSSSFISTAACNWQ